MSSTVGRSADSSSSSSGATKRQVSAIAALLIVESLLIAVPLVVLGQAVDWPASLEEPAAWMLPMVAENETALRVGYLVYLAYSLLFLPAIAATVYAFSSPQGWMRPVAQVAVMLAAISALARGIGITRWLTAIPVMADAWPDADPALRQVLSVQFRALNDASGGVGELLGVSAFGAAAVGAAVFAIRHQAPRTLTWLGVIAVIASLLPLVELAGLAPGALTSVGVSCVQVWFLAIAGVLIFRNRSGAQR
jgi:hypothetical protein